MANNIELRFDPVSGSWRYWDDVANQFADPQPTDFVDSNLVVLDANVIDNNFYNAGAGSDTYLVTANFDANITISDALRDTASDTYNIVRFESGLDISGTVFSTNALGSTLTVTLANGKVITVNNLAAFRFQVDDEDELTAETFASFYANTFAGNRAVFNALAGEYTIRDTDVTQVDVGAAVIAVDADGDAVTYSLDAASQALGFVIDQSTGQIAFTGNVQYAVNDQLTVTVIATSNGPGGTPREVALDVVISVISGMPASDAVFDALAGTFELTLGEDGRQTPITIGQPVTATDANADEIVYSLDAASLAAGFVIDAVTGQVSFVGGPDAINQAAGTEFLVTVIATSIGSTGAPVNVAQIVPVMILSNVIAGDDGANVIDQSQSSADLIVNLGDGNDQVTTGIGNDRITGGLGDDQIDLSGGGRDHVSMRVSFDGAALDGGDRIVSFEAGDDVVEFDKEPTDSYTGSGAEPETTAEWLATLTGGDGVGLNGDDLLIVSPIIALAGDGTPSVTGLRFHFREGSLYNNGASVSSSAPELIFETPMSATEFFAAIGGESNYDADLMAIIDLTSGLRGILGRDGIRYGADTVVKTTLVHADIVAALANDEDLWNWDVSAITSGSGLFYDVSEANTDIANFNQDIGDWDVSAMTITHSMFRGASSFNQDIGDWDVTNVTNYVRMFYDALSFNQDIGNWNVSAAQYMNQMFYRTEVFNQDIGGWDVGNVTAFASTFQYARVFDQDIGGWDVGSATSMYGMFFGAWAFNQDISTWDVSSVTDLRNMFKGARAFDQSLADWDISSVTQADFIFDVVGESALSSANLDATFRGWARLDTASGETAIQNNVVLGASGQHYTAATAVNYLETVYGWDIQGLIFDSANAWQGTDTADSYSADVLDQQRSFHGLGGNDAIVGTTNNEHFYGGAGNDTLTGGGGSDTFHYLYTNSADDTITDFDAANDVIDLSLVLIGYDPATSNLSDFVQAVGQPGDANTQIVVSDVGDNSPDFGIVLQGVAYTTTMIDDLLAADALVLV